MKRLIGLLFAVTLHTHGVLAEPVNVEHLLEREKLGLTFEASNGVMFEVVRSASSYDGPLPYYQHDHEEARKRVFFAPLDGSGDASELFEQDPLAGYWFAGSRPSSPNKRYWAIVRTHNGSRTLGVFDSTSAKFRRFDFDVSERSTAFSVAWASNESIVFLGAESVGDGLRSAESRSVAASRRRAAAREDAWTERQVTSDHIGSGRFQANAFDADGNVDVIVLNVRTGESRSLSSGRFSKLEMSASGSFVSVIEEVVTGNKADSTTGLSGLAVSRRLIRVFDTRTGKSDSLSGVSGEHLSTFSWSPKSDLLMVRSTVIDRSRPTDSTMNNKFSKSESFRRMSYRVYDPNLKQVLVELDEPYSNQYWMHGPFWIGDAVLSYAAEANGEEGEGRWVVTSQEERSQTLWESESHILGLASDHVFSLEAGEIWRTTVSGEREHLSLGSRCSELRPIRPLEYALGNANRITAIGRASRFVVGRGIPEDAIVVSAKCEDRQALFRWSSQIGDFASLGDIAGDVEVVNSTPDGTFFLENSADFGSRAFYRSIEGDLGRVPYLEFNEALIGVFGSEYSLPVRHSVPGSQSLTSWLHFPPGVSSQGKEQFPLVVLSYAGVVFGDTLPANRGMHSYGSVWAVQAKSPTVLELYTGAGYAVLTPSIPLSPVGEADDLAKRIPAAVESALDAAIETGWVDSERVAVVGHSFGGFTALTLAGQSDRFRAVVSSAGISNFTDHYGEFREVNTYDAAETPLSALTSMWMFELGQNRMGSPPWEDAHRYLANSPLFAAGDVTVPVMLIHGDLDFIDMGQSEQMFSALARQDKDVLFVRYWGEGHLIEQPQNQRDMWNRIFHFLRDSGVTPGQESGELTHVSTGTAEGEQESLYHQ